ncbi:MAG: hypothetical protein GY841_05675 [FCB group bacterium]|nr:hypothetical protein [FCB group bacterium]
MEKHVNVLGILFIVFGIMGLIGAGIVFVIFVMGGLFSGVASDQPEIALVAGTFGMIITSIILFTSLPSIFAGFGLMKFKSWARILGIIIGILNLPGFPVGTALGIYTLWVLLNADTIRLFNSGQSIPPD